MPERSRTVDVRVAEWIGPRFDNAPALLDIDISPYKNIDAWLGRLRAKPYWKDA